MTPATLLSAARADGVALTLTAAGTIKAAGRQAAVARWLPEVREHKEALLVALSEPHRLWDIVEPSGACWRSCVAPPQTLAQILAAYGPGTSAVPVEDPDEGQPLPPDIEAAVLEWLDQIGEDCPDIRAQILDRARDAPEARADYVARPATPRGPNHEGTDPSGTDPQEPKP